MNNNLNGYTLFSQPSRSAAGGVAIYASKSLNAFKRTDLSQQLMMNLKLFGLKLITPKLKISYAVVPTGTLHLIL